MCGIFGMTGPFATTANDDKFIKNATIAGAVRGLDGTGLVMIANKGDEPVTYIKRAMSGGQFVNEVFDPTYALSNTVHSVIGHNRAATIGAISDHTSHPFNEGGVIGVHNGTLRGDWKADLEVSKKCDVDSRGLYRAIAARGIDWTIDKMKGAAALVWCEVESKRVFVYRNSERPLHYVESNGKIYYASEPGMLSWLLTKSCVFKIDIQPFKVDTLYEITEGKLVELRTLKATANDEWGYYSQFSQGVVRGAANKVTQTLSKFSAPKTTPSGYNKPRSQNGVVFRGENVTVQERDRGIVEEYAERGFEEHQCICCPKPITDSFYYEERDYSEIKMHGTCLNVFRAQHDPSSKLRRIVRDPKLRTLAA